MDALDRDRPVQAHSCSPRRQVWFRNDRRPVGRSDEHPNKDNAAMVFEKLLARRNVALAASCAWAGATSSSHPPASSRPKKGRSLQARRVRQGLDRSGGRRTAYYNNLRRAPTRPRQGGNSEASGRAGTRSFLLPPSSRDRVNALCALMGGNGRHCFRVRGVASAQAARLEERRTATHERKEAKEAAERRGQPSEFLDT